MKNFVFALIAMLAPVAALAAEVDTRGLPGIYCEKPKALLYQEKDMNDFLDVTLVADHAEINSHGVWNEESPRSRAVIRVRNSKGVTEIFAGLLSSRGKSRKGSCATKPLRLEFLDPKISEEIESDLAQANILPSSERYLSSYHAALLKVDEARVKTAVPPSQGLFAKLGDDIKIVTHCGPRGHAAHEASEIVQNDRVRSEFYLYRILQTLKLPVEATRGANFTYLNSDGSPVFTSQNAQGKNIHFRTGFFREPPKSSANRCGLFNKPPVNAQEVVNADSQVQATFANNFILNNDWSTSGHNTNALWNSQGEKFLIIYDFDLSGVFFNGRVDENLINRQKYIALAKYTLQHRAKIQALLDKAILESATRNQFNSWLESRMERLEEIVEPTQP